MKRAGFTMIELIFVIVILGILAAVSVPNLSGIKDDALIANANENFCMALRTSLLNKAIRSGTISGFDLNNSLNLPSGFSYINGSVLGAGNLNDSNQTSDLIPAITNSSSIYIYFIDGDENSVPICAIGNSNSSTKDAQTLRDDIDA